MGRDSMDITLSAAAGDRYTVGNLMSAGHGNAAFIQDNNDNVDGIVFAGLSSASVATHCTTAMVGGVEHLYIH